MHTLNGGPFLCGIFLGKLSIGYRKIFAEVLGWKDFSHSFEAGFGK